MLIWDVRDNRPVNHLYGPIICGDGIDVYKNTIVTASWSSSNQLQEWNLGKYLYTILYYSIIHYIVYFYHSLYFLFSIGKF